MKIDKNTAQEIEKYLDSRVQESQYDATMYVDGERGGAEKVLRLLGINCIYVWDDDGGRYVVCEDEEAEA